MPVNVVYSNIAISLQGRKYNSLLFLNDIPVNASLLDVYISYAVPAVPSVQEYLQMPRESIRTLVMSAEKDAVKRFLSHMHQSWDQLRVEPAQVMCLL